MKPGFTSGTSSKSGRLSWAWSVFFFLFFLSIIAGCGKVKTEVIGVTFNGDSIPVVRTENVETFISDSGVTRYRIDTKVWEVYDKAKDPYWYFPQKIYVERFDSLLAVEGSIEADTAYFYKLRNLWRLVGHVKVLNLAGETFETSELFWDQRTAQIYANDSVRVQQKDKVIIGKKGFRSNQEMTRYSFFESEVQMNIREEADSLGSSEHVE
jgi:hypothetical protein